MLSRWQSTIVDAQGNVQPGSVLTIRHESDQSLAQVYMSPSDQQPYPLGQVPADSSGFAYFYAPAGLYRIQSQDLSIDWRHVPLGNLAAMDSDQLAGELGLGTAATRDVGTGANEVPANSNLGAAAYLPIATTSQAQALTNDAAVITPKKLLDSGAVFAGEVRVFAGAEANIPEGWLPCNGSAVSRSTYARLFAAIGTTYGSGNGSTTFNIPDLRGEFIRGLDNGRGVDAGRALGSAQADALQNITGAFWNLIAANVTGVDDKMGSTNGVFDTYARNADVVHRLSSTSYQQNIGNKDGISFDASRVARTADETRPRNVAMNYIIKY